MFEAFSKYADFSGRASRSEFWLFQLLNVSVIAFSCALIYAGGVGASPEDHGEGPAAAMGPLMIGTVLWSFWGLISLVPSIAVTVRRFHDHNISGWWCLGFIVLSVIPFVNILAFLLLLWVLVRGGTWARTTTARTRSIRGGRTSD